RRESTAQAAATDLVMVPSWRPVCRALRGLRAAKLQAGAMQVRPRIPDTQQRRSLEKRRSIREIVFGMQDGILTTLGIITGVGVAEGDRAAVFISGFLALLAGALSMGVGEYLGRKSEREVVQATIDLERREMA